MFILTFVFFLRKERRVDNIEIQKFISKKADLLFALSWKSDAPTTAEVSEDNDGVFSLKIVAFWFNSTLMKQNTELLLVILVMEAYCICEILAGTGQRLTKCKIPF